MQGMATVRRSVRSGNDFPGLRAVRRVVRIHMTGRKDPAISGQRKRVGVIASLTVSGLERLLPPLERVFPVCFETIQTEGMHRIDAALVLDAASLSSIPRRIPRLVAAPPCDQGRHQGAMVALVDDVRVQRPLRGRTIREDAAAALALSPRDPGEVLAGVGREPVWWVRGDGDEYLGVSAYALPHVAAEGALRDHLRPGNFMGLLPLLHFLETTVAPLGWQPSPLRASFVIDDPNLHWPSYSYLSYPDMVAHAHRHGYHVGLAMVPLDGWMASGRAASLLKRNPSALSLMMHGNDHRSRELGRLTDEQAATAVIAQALRRTSLFERRTGVPVQRVMVPPHEVCSKASLRAMFRLGLDAACIGQRYPWRTTSSSPDAWPLAKWHPADMVAGGLPILPRCSLERAREDLAFRALLRQPLILYGHHGDLADGLDLLAEAAGYVNGLGEVQWGSVGWIADQSLLTKRSGEALIVEMHCRRATVPIPEGATLLEVRMPALCQAEPGRSLGCDSGRISMTLDDYGWTSGELRVAPGTRVRLDLKPRNALDPMLVPPPRVSPWPMMRRALVEGRDRLQPLSRGITARERDGGGRRVPPRGKAGSRHVIGRAEARGRKR
jgi:hypothetical protein